MGLFDKFKKPTGHSDKTATATAPEPAGKADPTPDASSEPESAELGGQAGEDNYIVQPGDTLWKIAATVYGNGGHYMAIFEANRERLDDPNKLYPGQELVIPSLDD